jgi:hypothetical protein
MDGVYAKLREGARARGIELELNDTGTWWAGDPESAELASRVCRKGLLDAVWEVSSWHLPGLVPASWAKIDGGRPERVVPPVVVALNALADLLEGKTFVGAPPTPEGVRALIFRGTGAHMFVFWTLEDAPPFLLTLPQSDLPREVTTCVGAPLRAYSVQEEVEIPVTSRPQFIFMPGEAWGAFRAQLLASRFRRGLPGRLRSR